MSLGEVLRNLLDERDVTQKQLADSLNIGASTIGNYIQNIREPDYEVLRNLADFFDVSIDYLLEHRSKKCVSESGYEDELLRLFRVLTNEQQEFFIEQGKLLITHGRKRENSSESIPSEHKSR